ncbi:MAG TPA: 16S rRNA (cytidine(1402)-2'-O)-methyltransferase [bacterium]|nr:16S rRNA (cytidine(1402)-2'-O)-methyltransferase [bacterium]
MGTLAILKPNKSGKLFLVSTPIGNLKDISLRAIEVLKQVDLIAAEDTRRAAILLKHYQIGTATTSFFDFNKEKKTPLLIQKLRERQAIALISDAGTPGISDPAFYLVRAAIREGIDVEAVPGATAFVPALIVSGLPTDRFVFEGFLPVKKGRLTRLMELAGEKRTIIIYESPRRVIKTLTQLVQHLGNRHICIAREITKKFEQIYRGEINELLDNPEILKLKGEFVIVIEGNKTNRCNAISAKIKT